ncbi:MAG: DUF4340 domain-containing protein [Bacteroidales bacterium]|nr:DUF4340 domain-containing protein [Bacteroidales bacterium]
MVLSRKKRNILIIALVVVIGIIALIVSHNGAKKATFAQDFHVSDISTITKIYMVDKNSHQVLLTRQSQTTDTTWLVDERYAASQPMIDMLLETLNTMRIRQQVNKNAVANIIKDLSGNSVKVEVYQKVYFINWFKGKLRLFPHEKCTVTYFVGRETQDQMASYIYREGDKYPYIIHIPGFRGYLTPRFTTSSYAWRSHAIVNLDVRQIERIELSIIAAPEESFAVYRDGDNFAMELTAQHTRLNGFDSARVAQMLISMKNLNFDEYAAVVPNSNMDTSFREGPRNILRITDTASVTHEVKTYIKYINPNDAKAMPDPELYTTFDIDRLYAIIDDKDTVVIQYYVFDNILQPASFFMQHP